MPRANRYHLPGQVWHITHRCHNRDFLLKFRCDRNRYRDWLCEAKKRHGLRLLNYNLTCNHVHLLIYDEGHRGVIEDSLQLVAGRIAQEYNRRKGRVGAFWQGRYHATAVQSGRHLRNCFTYIDLNMVRAGRAAHPSNWPSCGYQDLQQPRKRGVLLDIECCADLLGLESASELAHWQGSAIADALSIPHGRDPVWTESVAVGDTDYLKKVAGLLRSRSRFLKVVAKGSQLCLEERPSGYGANLTAKMPI